jgi:hypothetical protein
MHLVSKYYGKLLKPVMFYRPIFVSSTKVVMLCLLQLTWTMNGGEKDAPWADFGALHGCRETFWLKG